MIKKSTLVVLLAAIALGAAVYYLDWKRGLKEKDKPADAANKPAFTIAAAADIRAFSISRPSESGQPAMRIEKRGGTWRILQPIDTDADQPSLELIASGLAEAHLDAAAPGTPDRLRVFGLDPPIVSVEFQLANGAKHTLKLGGKDFTGMSVYAIVDGAKDVALLPQSLLFATGKTVDQLRDHTVLHIVSGEAASFDLKNSSGQLSASRDKEDWIFTKPAITLADAGGVNTFLGGVGSAKMTAIVSETPDKLAKYGLAAPAITFSSVDAKGKSSTLLVGKKDGEEYFARDAARPMIFRINAGLYKTLMETYSDLRDKKLVHFDPSQMNRVELHNANGTMVCTRKSEEEWTIEAPAEQKGKSAGAWKILSPFTTAKGEELIDHPGRDILAKLAKPGVEAVFTDKAGKKLSVRLSSVAGDFVYAQASDSPTVYKLRKQVSEDLSFKASDLAF